MYVYKESEARLWTVGYYEPNGKWQPESDHHVKEKAAERVHYLNGGCEVTIRLPETSTVGVSMQPPLPPYPGGR